MDTGNMNTNEPDADSIKLFIGQIPKDITEDELKEMFQGYGPIYQLNKVKDKVTNEHKGCAFVTFYKRQSALDAQSALHEKKSYPGLKGPMQVKPANSELLNEEEKKLFIGMIPRGMTDDELYKVMEPYGAVQNCVILKDKDGVSKGCAFVTYATKKSAANAIQGLNHIKTLEGATGPMVVKIAETQREKELKKKASMGLSSGGGYAGMLGQQSYPVQSADGNDLGALGNPTYQNLSTALTAIATDPVLSTLFNPNMALIQQLQAQGGLQSAYTSPALNGSSAYSNSSTTLSSNQMPTPSGNQLPNNQTFGIYNQQSSGGGVATWKNPGMEDCNLFIFNIPEELKDVDLVRLFCPYGNVISTRVYYDKRTGRSKGFGFVSYDNTASCKAAIQAMNGAHVGNRRIKVELKKPRADSSKPY